MTHDDFEILQHWKVTLLPGVLQLSFTGINEEDQIVSLFLPGAMKGNGGNTECALNAERGK